MGFLNLSTETDYQVRLGLSWSYTLSVVETALADLSLQTALLSDGSSPFSLEKSLAHSGSLVESGSREITLALPKEGVEQIVLAHDVHGQANLPEGSAVAYIVSGILFIAACMLPTARGRQRLWSLCRGRSA